jgi:hypothetical protein
MKGVRFVFLTGSVLFVVGAAMLWDGAGFVMALGFVLLLMVHAATLGCPLPQVERPGTTVMWRI